MSIKTENQPAFPVFDDFHGEVIPGMTLRDWFAGQAIEGFNRQMVAYEWGEDVMDKAARVAYQIADAMLRARVAP